MDVRARRCRETSPDRVKINRLQQWVKPSKKIQVVYYLSRNGHLQHPHYLEVTHLANQPLRLKDVMDRLIALRGKGLPTQYSWSCKKSYKSGYVWYDLAENDIICPAEGAEYVLKGSELYEVSPEKRLQQLHVNNTQPIQQEPSFNLKVKPVVTSGLCRETEEEYDENQDEVEEAVELEYQDGEKTSYTSSTTTPHSRCSRGVSTDELEDYECPIQTHKKPILNQPTTTVNDAPPPPPTTRTSTSSVSDKQNQANAKNDDVKGKSFKTFQEGDPFEHKASASSHHSVLLQLVACGKPAVDKVRNSPCLKKHTAVKKSESLNRGVVYKSAAAKTDINMINYMSENPRFGNLQSEEKEYFSGSMVESITEDRVGAGPSLKKSNSYNEERSSKVGLDGSQALEEQDWDKKREIAGLKGKCIPRIKSTVLISSSKQRGQ
ncbi:protein UPSTREAM OF FLC [Quillaja saponaria]|uniref:Protein UPSTREAM OF FLC n=1 Tax=Quillaja saponaria TaxID=32244 RepID=A0AAD7LFD6_QUISA|nr:protein UPSTREAM OF FLC [Quillaja saponaria]